MGKMSSSGQMTWRYHLGDTSKDGG